MISAEQAQETVDALRAIDPDEPGPLFLGQPRRFTKHCKSCINVLRAHGHTLAADEVASLIGGVDHG